MRLARFETGGRTVLGVVVGDEVVELGVAAPDLPSEVLALLAAGPDALAAAARAVAAAPTRMPLEEARLRAPVPRPPKFLAIGLNYTDHIAETGATKPEFPVFFNKQSTCVIGPGDPIYVPPESEMVDYEGELGLVIGQRARRVPAARAADVIAGYLVVNDVSVRDWQMRSPTMTLGKSWDTHGPIGPWIVTPDEVGDPHALGIRTLVSGEVMQDGSTADMIVDCFEQVAVLSRVCTLEPGDVISTGTPAGVGFTRRPPRFLRPGDVVRIEIEGIGRLENPVVGEPVDPGCPP